MQKSDLSPSKQDRDSFIQSANEHLARITAELAALHGEPPCLFAVDIQTVRGWDDTKRDATLKDLQRLVTQAEEIVRQAELHRAKLWEASNAHPEDKALPPIIHLKQLREDLSTYKDILAFVQSHP